MPLNSSQPFKQSQLDNGYKKRNTQSKTNAFSDILFLPPVENLRFALPGKAPKKVFK